MKRILTSLALLCTVALTAFSSDDRLSLKTVVIDPGHGGKDPGAVSKDGKSFEKTFVLDIAGLLADKIREGYPDVKVIMTRSTDHFVTLNDRAAIANKAGADLFISVHINSSAGTVANGYSVHVLGQSHKKGTDLYKANLAMVQRENSVITLDDDYNPETIGFDPTDPESYIFMTMMQSAYLEQSIAFAQIIGDKLASGPLKTNRGVSQDPFYVLWKTSMPSVLVELGFISNESDLQTLRQSDSREEIAECLYNAFGQYKEEYDKSMRATPRQVAPAVEPSPKPETKPALKQEVVPAPQPAAKPATVSKTKYGVQIATLSRLLPKGDSRLLGYDPFVQTTPNGKLYRYVIAVSDSKQEAAAKLSEISKKYPDCFLVKIEDGNISRAK